MLNQANKIITSVLISEGGISGTAADPRKIFKAVLENNGAAIILAHNHPSGVVSPSEADRQLTQKMKDAGKMLDMPVIDHIIIGDAEYFSFADEGML